MVKRTFILLIFGLVSYISYAQTLTCDKLAKQMEADPTKHIWYYDSIPPETYYCIGKYFAQRDIDRNVFLIQTFDPSYDEANLWKVCRYESYGFSFHYQPDIVLDNYTTIADKITKYAEGYNEISKAYLKAKIGDSAFAHLDDIPKDYFNPREFLTKNLNNGNYQNFFDVDIINDTTINVKLIADSLFKDYPQLATKVVYNITSDYYKNKSRDQTQRMNYKEIKEAGFRLTESLKHRYYFEINFYFYFVAKPSYWCPAMDAVIYSYILPLTIKL